MDTNPSDPTFEPGRDRDLADVASPEASQEKFSLDQVGYWAHILPKEFIEFLRKQELLEGSPEDAVDAIRNGLNENQYGHRDILDAQIHNGFDILEKVDAVVSSGKYTSRENLTIADALEDRDIAPENRLAFSNLLRRYGFETILDTYILGEIALQKDDLGGDATLQKLFDYVYGDLLRDAEKLMGGNYNNGSSRISVHHHYHGMNTVQVIASALVLAILASRYTDINGKQVLSDADRALNVVAECVEGLRCKVREIFYPDQTQVPQSNPATESGE